ncbi:MAG: SPOR domain-containing protein [Bdellovibrionaceae bacterium]|nr:SPOR domain-containing protein [Pseudobdellovibrionaceae bacterium]MDW8190844.1 SPOR domain-containing protein [Pseudobdellovibrionaceae bacterium]
MSNKENSGKNQQSSGDQKIDVVVKVVAFFFSCLLSFAFGAYVGKRFSDHQHKQAQLMNVPGETKQQVAQQTDQSTGFSSSEDFNESLQESEILTPEEIETLAKNFEQATGEPIQELKQEGEDSPRAPAHEKNTPPTSPKDPSNASASKESPNPSDTTTPTKKIETQDDSKWERQAESIKKNFPVKYTVQVAAFPSAEEAQKLVTTLTKKNVSAFSVKANIPDKRNPSESKTWYRVNIGLYASVKEAEAAKNEMIANKIIQYGFVQKLSDE